MDVVHCVDCSSSCNDQRNASFSNGTTKNLDDYESRWIIAKRFSKIHPKYKTPGFATIITGLVVGLPMFFTDESFILDFTSIGTLFAFVLVCGGVLMLPSQSAEEKTATEATKGKFRLPYINAKFSFPLIIITTFSFLIYQFFQIIDT